MRIVVIGGLSLAGHLICRYLAEETPHELLYTHQERANRPRSLYLDAGDPVMVEQLMRAVRPELIINCHSIMNDAARLREREAYRVNGLFPHQLAELADQQGAKLIQISTDSVFFGDRGMYTERHVPDGTTVYARTKALGEVLRPPHLTLRTSLLGPDLEASGLLSWFLAKRGSVKGFVNVAWNGITTLELAKFIRFVLTEAFSLSGVVHLTAKETTDKCRLLELVRTVFEKDDIVIQPDDAITLDRTLRCTRTDVEYRIPTYIDMLTELREWMISHR
ncbi:sugar nucleotide-binding protein [Paenibacillus cremeus]|uniref:dTDP-4-dehydrorhamnose reductase n=1 Tax=Paenibacillus cremeus TaxID=2163881 RepID=A0A559KI57_9BACL|nr:sugar nucleotide-binding protein [Paenibacillus cremeus]TVY11823.1 sugar nucleotide-binding protein [Paenibacillus cremeus]